MINDIPEQPVADFQHRRLSLWRPISRTTDEVQYRGDVELAISVRTMARLQMG
jgi:hypothetical protein